MNNIRKLQIIFSFLILIAIIITFNPELNSLNPFPHWGAPEKLKLEECVDRLMWEDYGDDAISNVNTELAFCYYAESIGAECRLDKKKLEEQNKTENKHIKKCLDDPIYWQTRYNDGANKGRFISESEL